MLIDIFSCTNLKIDYRQKKYFSRFASVQYLLVQNETGSVASPALTNDYSKRHNKYFSRNS